MVLNVNNQMVGSGNNSFMFPSTPKEIGLNDLLERDFLIEDLGILNSGDNNFLHLAAQSSDYGLVEDLIKKIKEKKFDINHLLLQKNSEGKTPLHLVFENENKQIVELFIQMISGKSASLHTCMKEKKIKELEDFLANCPNDFCRALLLNTKDSDGCTLFNLALKDDELIHLCLRSFKQGEERFKFVSEPLKQSLFSNNLFMLIESADLSVKKLDTFFGFFIHDLNKLKFLLSTRNNSDSTPLHVVVESMDLDCARKILTYIKLLDVDSQEQILCMEDDGGHIPMNVLPYVKVDINDRNEIISAIYNAASRTTQKKMLRSKDEEGNTFFHLLASKVEEEFSDQFVVNCKSVFGDLMTKMKLSIAELVILSKIENDEGDRPLEQE